MVDLLVAVRPAYRVADYPGVVDLHESLALPRVRENTRLWVEGGDLIGFALVDHYRNLCFEFDPQAAHPGLPSEMIAWGAARVQRDVREGREALTLDASCRDDDADRIALLQGHGFVRQAWRTLRMTRSLEEPIPAPRVPALASVTWRASTRPQPWSRCTAPRLAPKT